MKKDDNTLELFMPDAIPITSQKVKTWQALNTDLFLSADYNKNMLIIEGKEYYLRDYESIPLNFPQNMWIEEPVFDQLEAINEENCLTIETNGNNLINLRMGITAGISLITGAIIISLGIWNSKNKKGRIYTENGEFRFKDKTKKDGYSRYMPDVSFISYDDVSEEEQKKFAKTFIPVPPTVSVEVVSAKYGLKPALRKAKKVWKKEGTKLTLVLCPFSKMIYIFEKGVSGYKTQSVYQIFTHSLLPGYEGDFSQYIDDVD